MKKEDEVKIERLLKTVERKLTTSTSVAGSIKKRKPAEEPKFLKGKNMAICLDGMDNESRRAMRQFFQG